jgi:hypothetical protein
VSPGAQRAVEEAAPVLVIDDGELEDVLGLLRGLGVPFGHVRGAATQPLVEPSDLLIVTGRRALLLDWDDAEDPARGVDRALRIAICQDDSVTVRDRLRSRGYDFLVRRPVHPEALRLLLLCALYRGPERRSGARVPIGAAVTLRTARRRRPAVLAELSEAGCRLVVGRRLRLGTPIHVQLPDWLVGGDLVDVRGRVVRTARARTGDGKEVELGVRFDTLAPRTRKIVRGIVQERETGTTEVGGDPEAAREKPGSVRSSVRRAYQRRVIALRDEAAQVIMGRNLSTEGMAIDWREDMAPGDELRLAIYGEAGGTPLVLGAEVIHADPEDGIGLRFQKLLPELADRLEALVAGLPPIESLAGEEADALGSVVTRIVRRDAKDARRRGA